MTAFSRLVLRYRHAVLCVWALVLAVGVFGTSITVDRLAADFSLPDQRGYEDNLDILEHYGAGGPGAPLVVVTTFPEGTTIDSPEATDALTRAADQLTEHGLRVASPLQPGGAGLVSQDGRTALNLVYPPFTGGDDGPPAQIVEGVASAYRSAVPSGTDVEVTGLDLLAEGEEEEGEDDIALLIETLLGAVAALVVLLFVFGSLLALLPLLVAAVSILASFLGVLGMTYLTDVIFIVQFAIALIGLGIAIDYSLLLVTRWREERSRGHDPIEATHRAMATAGRAVVFSGLTVAVGLLILVLIPVPFLRVFGLACMLIPLCSVGVTMTLLPVILATVGARLDWPRRQRGARPGRLGLWWARLVLRHRWLAILGAAVLLTPLIIAALGIRLGEAPAHALANTAAARAAVTAVTDTGVPAGVFTPIEVMVPDASDAPAIIDRLSDLDGVYAVIAPQETGWRIDGTALVSVIPEAETSTDAGQTTVEQVQQAVDAEASGVRVGGSGAYLQAEKEALYGWFPLLLALVGLTTFVLLARAFRSLVLAAQAIVLNLLSIGAAYGGLVLIWQEGYGSQLLWDIPALGSVSTFVPLMAFAFLFGLSMDYEVFLLSRIREEYDRTGSTRLAVTEGLGRIGRLVTCAALILFFAFASLAMAPEIDVKIIATALGVGILIDATVLRMLLVPALVAVSGRWTWWLPVWMARLLRVAPSPPAPRTTQVADAMPSRRQDVLV